MTSKEALELIYSNHQKREWQNQILIEKAYEIIKKDLEVLKIIKDHKLLNYVIKNPKCAKMYHLTEDEIEKLKEFMEVKA